MIKVTASTLTFTACKQGNPNPIKEGLKNRHTSTGFSIKSQQKMLSRLRNFMFFRRYELSEKSIREKTDISGVTFLTTTLPTKQVHTDLEIKSVCLDNFMNKLRYHLGKFSYVWKAEAQANGNIHFHFIIDSNIDKKISDKLWHDSIDLLGYVTSFEKKHGHRNPPTNRIERAKSLRKVIGYATKYIAKIDSHRQITGQNWYSSKDLQTDAMVNVLMSKKEEKEIKRRLRNLGLYCASNEYGEKYFLSETSDIKELPMKLRHIYEEVIQYHLGRQICESGMERIYRQVKVTQLREYTTKRKIMIEGLQEFPTDLFI